ncbi:aldolase [Bacillus cereus]|uniref:aldolase n=1 Tax=Bacillus sp. AFS023182 TaxID=2033492 RepID=UPI000BF39DD4|nr:aldolase [Bacillus sp. AFS023182]PFE04354.1 aldolase [Bacillus sp. AFS023182]PGY05070.1 aldolase [Bacillus cereus]
MIHTVKKVVYKAFGLTLLSEIPLPELPQLNNYENEVDVRIETADLSKLWKELSSKKSAFVVEEELVMFQIPETATFCIQNGEKIIVSPMEGSDQDKIRLYILGTCMGALLMQRKILPLHGSAIAINGKVYAFVGRSGAGKSTLASALLSKGYQLLSDDVIAVSLSEDNIPFVTPSYPQQKLWKESLDQFGMETTHYQPLFERETKYAVPVSSSFFNEPLPLAGVFELVKTENENVEIQRIEGLERLRTLLRHTYRNSLIPRLEMMEWHFMNSTNIVNKVEMFQLRRPISKFTAHDLVSTVLESLKEEEK